MKANEAPEKLHLLPNGLISYCRTNEDDIEYVRKDAFIEKVCEFWKDHMAGYDICEDDIERSIESFKLAMKL